MAYHRETLSDSGENRTKKKLRGKGAWQSPQSPKVVYQKKSQGRKNLKGPKGQGKTGSKLEGGKFGGGLLEKRGESIGGKSLEVWGGG